MNNAAVPARDEMFDDLLVDFLDESEQLLEVLNSSLLELDNWFSERNEGEETHCDDDLMNDMFRAAHSIKGLSGMLGLLDISRLTHSIENVFDAARYNRLQFDVMAVDITLSGVDLLGSMVERVRNPELEKVDDEEVLASIVQLLEHAGVQDPQHSETAARETLATAKQASEQEDSQVDNAAENMAGSEVPSPEGDAVQAESVRDDLFAGIHDEGGIPAKYMSIFIDEAELSLDTLSETLMAAEADQGPEAVESLLIVSHRIKGSAASVGLNRPAKLAHLMEDILQGLREYNQPISSLLTDAMLGCTDALRHYVSGLRSGNPESPTFSDLAHELLAAQAGGSPTEPQGCTETPENESRDPLASEAECPKFAFNEEWKQPIIDLAPCDSSGFLGSVHFEDSYPLVSLKAQLLLEKLSRVGEVFHCDPSREQLEHVDDSRHLIFAISTATEQNEIHTLLNIASVENIELHPYDTLSGESESEDSPAASTIAAPVDIELPASELPIAKTTEITNSAQTVTIQPDRSSKPSRATDTTRPAETIRVEIDRLDQLMNLAGQLVINRARLSQIGDRLKPLSSNKRSTHDVDSALNLLEKIDLDTQTLSNSTHAKTSTESLRSHTRRLRSDLESIQRDMRLLANSRGDLLELSEAVHQLDRVTDGIQKSVMDTRMVPVGPLFNRFKRVIRDITRESGKNIRLVIRGEKTELDKRMIDELGDPLIHMVRNAADHGIESPQQRQESGKPAQGTVTLDAFHRGNSIVVQVTDDGKGLPPERIRDKAIEKGMITALDAERMSNHQLLQLIWEPGLTTADKITEISGRGMGMDIVRSKIEDLNGYVELDSTPGEGTTFTIRLPLTLAILPSLMAKIDEEVFALPIESVVEIVQVSAEDFSSVHGVNTARVRGRQISVIHLNEIFDWNREGTAQADSGHHSTLVVIGTDGQELGLYVDQLLGEDDVVIKSMAENYRNVEGIAGASILGDGQISLILDIGALIQMASHRVTEVITQQP